jgi:acetyl/propionyl-CoA carboxylase alpha subunit
VVPGDVIGRVVTSGPTRQAALVKLAAGLAKVHVEGVSTGLERLREVSANRHLWEGKLHLDDALRLLEG